VRSGACGRPLNFTVRRPRVPLLDDIVKHVHQSFSGADLEAAIGLLAGARIHDGSPAEPRLQRCALVAAKESLQKLDYYVKLLAIDFRDVIVAGEYESVGGKLVRVRDLRASF
jgi:hypothetical protein